MRESLKEEYHAPRCPRIHSGGVYKAEENLDVLGFEVFKTAARISGSSLLHQVTKRRACDDMRTSV